MLKYWLITAFKNAAAPLISIESESSESERSESESSEIEIVLAGESDILHQNPGEGLSRAHCPVFSLSMQLYLVQGVC